MCIRNRRFWLCYKRWNLRLNSTLGDWKIIRNSRKFAINKFAINVEKTYRLCTFLTGEWEKLRNKRKFTISLFVISEFYCMSFNSFRVTCTKTHNVSLKFHVKEINITLFSLYCFEKPQNINTIKLSLSTLVQSHTFMSLLYPVCPSFMLCLCWCRSEEHSSLHFILQPYIWFAGVWGSANPTQNKNSLSLLLRIWSQGNQLPQSPLWRDRTPDGTWIHIFSELAIWWQ